MSAAKPRSRKTAREDISRQLVEVHSQQFSNGDVDSSPLADVREIAIRHFEDVGLPGTKDEAWRFTPIVRHLSDFTAAGSITRTVEDAGVYLTPDLEVDVVVTVDGLFRPDLSDIKDSQGVHVLSLSDARLRFPDVFAAHFGQYAKAEDESFVSLNTAFVEDGTFVYVEETSRAPRPIHLVHLVSDRAAALQYVRNLFVVDGRAEAYVIESYMAETPAHIFSNMVTEVYVGPHAHLDHYRLQGRPGASSVDTLRGYQGAESTYRVFTFTVGGRLVRNNITLTPDGPHCDTFMSGLFLIESDQHVDNHTLVEHTAPGCHSNELFKGILAGSAAGVFSGMLHVHRLAQQTNAFQSNRNLLLSNDATINTQPQLEIYADDVKCSHGATTGFLDNDAIFYLRARGISYRAARLLLMHAFTAEVTDRIKIPELRDHIDQLVSRRLEEIS